MSPPSIPANAAYHNSLLVPGNWPARGALSVRLWLFLKLAVIAFEQSAKKQILVQFRPMQTERRNFNVMQLPGRAWRPHFKPKLIFKNSASYSPVNGL